VTDYRQIGKRHPRLEDMTLLRGKGRFVDDLHEAGMLEAAFVRSPHAHAAIQGINSVCARQLPGVHAVFTLSDLSPHLSQERIPLQFRSTELPPNITPFVLAKDEVAFVGEAVAVVIADSRYIAEDAAALVQVQYDPLPVVADCRRALEPDAPIAHSNKTSNLLLEFRQAYGDIDAAFACASRHLTINLQQHRGCAHPIEGRGAFATYDENADRLTVWSSTQLVHEARAFLMQLLRRDENQIRVVAPDVGGGFGAKFVLYSEEVTIAVSSLLLRRGVKWTEDRREHFIAAIQERDQYWDLDAAFDGHMIHDEGAYTPQSINLAYVSAAAVPGPYILPAYELRVSVVETNKVAALSVRGAGYPEGTFAMERILDRIAGDLGLDRAEVRRRNLIPAKSMPYVMPMKSRAGTHIVRDSGDYPQSQKVALEAIDYIGFPDRQRRARAEGRFLGIGVGNGIKGTGLGPFESGLVRIGRSGRISVYTGAMPMGQGIKTSLAQICAEQFSVSADKITVVAGDTAAVPLGQGGFASRQTVTAGSSVHLAAEAVREKALRIAAHLLEASQEDLVMRDGRIEIAGAPGSGLELRQVAEAVSGLPGYSMPGNFEPGLESAKNFLPSALTYGIGTHAVEVEVDTETCGIRILRYVVVNDSGRMINPMIVEGQIAGGVAHGIGNALYEWMGYDEQAQPVTTTFADYLLPSASEIPPIEIKPLDFPSPLNPLGVKGVGEVGVVPAGAAIISAVENALEPFGIQIEEIPLRPTRLFALIQGARSLAPRRHP
jgi:aerobic carbon-monoxide dehydrogenase large subunit